jgi:hypothetical protein
MIPNVHLGSRPCFGTESRPGWAGPSAALACAGNSWLEPPLQAEMQLSNDFYFLISSGKPAPWSPQGFFDICPCADQGAGYPTNLSFSQNTIHPAAP